MNCKTVHKKLIFFLEGELTAKEEELVKAHLLHCSDCAAFAEDLKKTLGVLETEKIKDSNPFFYTRVKARMLAQESQQEAILKRPVFIRVVQPIIFSLLLIVGIYAGITIGNPNPAGVKITTNFDQEMIPYLNEMETESIETFLME